MRARPFRRHFETRARMAAHGLTLFTHSLCPYAHRAALTLCEKGLSPDTFERQVDLSDKPGDFLKVNPRGLVPTLRYADGSVITESLRIIRIIDEMDTLPRAARSLSGGAAREEILQFVDSCDAYGGFISAGLSFVGGGWGISRGKPNENTVETLEREVERLDALLRRSSGEFLFGDNVSLADIAIYPFAERFQLAMREFQSYDLGIDSNARAFACWLAAMAARDAVKQLRPDDAKLLASWRRTKRLDYFDYETASREAP